MLVYRQMNIGTAKPSEDELHIVPHHLVNILPPDASYSVADFQQQATELIHQITQRGTLPILVGGTGLYIKALLEDYRFSSVEENPELRHRLETYAQEQGSAKLFDWLHREDPAAAARLHPNDIRRVVRALETALSGEMPRFSDFPWNGIFCMKESTNALTGCWKQVWKKRSGLC